MARHLTPRDRSVALVAGLLVLLVAVALAVRWTVGIVADALTPASPSPTPVASAEPTPSGHVDPTVTTITVQPSDTNIPIEGSRRLGVRAEGPERTYQWQRLRPGLDPDEDADHWVDIEGATKRTLKVPGAERHDGAHYRVIITTDYEQLVSEPAQVSVVAPTKTPVTDAGKLYPDKKFDAAGVDVSRWNRIGAGASAKAAGWEFVIAKVGGSDDEGAQYQDSRYERHVASARAAGQRVGHYWFNGAGDPEDDADYFVDHLTSYRDGDPLVLDIEPYRVDGEEERRAGWSPDQAVIFLEHVRDLLPDANLYVYMSADLTWDDDWSAVAGLARLWVATWGDNTGTVPTSEPDVNWWDDWTIWQFSSWGRPDGYSWSRIDVNLARPGAWG